MPSKKEKLPISVTFASSFPELIPYVDGWDPTQFTAYSNKRVNWKCSKNHSWTSTINNITSKGSRSKTPCPYCLNQRVLVGFNDLATCDPELAREAYGWDPTSEVSGSHKKKSWRCSNDHIWDAAIFSRSGDQKSGCPYCANQKVWPGFNDLATKNPELASEADGWDPTRVTFRANKHLPWKCPLGHRWTALLSNRGKGIGCPFCANQKVLRGFNDLQSREPELAREAHLWNPSTVVSLSERKLEWRCALGHIYRTSPARRLSGDGCPFCSGHQVLFGFNDLLTLNPDLATQAIGWDPSTLTSKSSKRRKWKCDQGHQWIQSVATRAAGIGCPSCAKSGYDPNKDGYIYFLIHNDWEMLQIGITNVPDIRLSKHSKNGWRVLELRGPIDGHLTQQWETAILRMLKANGADLSNSEIAGKFDGYSEAWSKSTFEVTSIKELMRLTEEFEENGKRVN